MEKTKNVPSAPLEWVRRNSVIGKGSFGTVNLAVSKSDGRVFAVKSVNLKTALPSHIESLENEIRILQTLSSPHVVGYLGNDLTHVSVTATYRNLHMEYLPGGTVADVARKFGCNGAHVDEHIVRSYTWHVVAALSYVHSRGFVHCDVKGSNVLVGSTSGVAKLADFGSARRISGCVDVDDDEDTPIVARGTPLWMAPEVIRQERQGPESDVWSLGCTVIEMITGRAPWKDFGASSVCQIGFSNELPEFPPQLSELGRDFLNKCLRREPSERWRCDQLLQHPFVSVDFVFESSPRSVLDWSNSEFYEGEIEVLEEEEEEEDIKGSNFVISAKDRIKELASDRKVFWESDGWEAVRLGSEQGREGTSSEYLNFPSARVENDCNTGSDCQIGLQKEEKEHYSWCKLFLLIIILRFHLLCLLLTSSKENVRSSSHQIQIQLRYCKWVKPLHRIRTQPELIRIIQI